MWFYYILFLLPKRTSCFWLQSAEDKPQRRVDFDWKTRPSITANVLPSSQQEPNTSERRHSGKKK